VTPDVLLLALRFLRYGLAMLLWGAGLYATLVVPAGLGIRLRTRIADLPVLAAVALVTVVALRLPLMAASFATGWPDALRPDVLAAVLQTWTGTGWIVEAVLAVFLVAAAGSPRLRWRITTPLAGLLLATSVMTGHAAIGAGVLGPLHQLLDAAHLLAAGFWLGALPPLALMLKDEGASPDAVRAIERFGTAGQAAVAVVLLTGITNALLVKRGVPLSWSSTYDILLLLKITVVLGMTGLAAYNRLGLLPRLAIGSNNAARTLRRTALLEAALGLTAVGLVSVFGTLDTA
jgi:putative copper resistance protein D